MDESFSVSVKKLLTHGFRYKMLSTCSNKYFIKIHFLKKNETKKTKYILDSAI
jgi:hypothetical protein